MSQQCNYKCNYRNVYNIIYIYIYIYIYDVKHLYNKCIVSNYYFKCKCNRAEET